MKRHARCTPRLSRIAASGFVLAFGLHASQATAQDVLYGMSDVGQYGGPDEIVRIDRATGVATRVHVFSTGFNLLESLCFDTRESVLWSTNDGTLFRVDPTTWSTAIVGATGVEDVDGIAIQPSTGALFGITYGGNDLIRIDKTDGGASILNSTLEIGARLEDLAFDSTGRLYVLTSRAIVEVNPANGARISRVYLTGATSLEGLVWDPQRGTFLSAADRGGFKDLVTINRTTGAVEFVSASHSGFKDIEALAFVPGPTIVPVAMQALEASRDDQGALLAWQSAEDGIEYVVERGDAAVGPWSAIGRVSVPAGGRTGAWRFEYRDAEAASARLAGETVHYRIVAADGDGILSFVQFEVQAQAPSHVVLRPNSPNPFNPTTMFEVRLTAPARIELELYDVQGRVVRTLAGDFGAGTHRLVWDGRDAAGRGVAAGIYPYRIRGADRVLRGSAVLVK